MVTPSRIALAFLCSASLLLMVAGLAEAQPRGAIRGSTRSISRAISLNTERLIKPRLVVARGSTGPVKAVAVSGDERILVMAAGDGSLRVWDLKAGRQASMLRGGGDVAFLSVSADGGLAVASGSGGAVVWNLRQGSSSPLSAGGGQARRGVFSGNKIVVGTSSGTVLLLDASGKQLKSHAVHTSPVSALAADPGGKFAVSAAEDGSIKLTDLASGSSRPLEGFSEKVTALAAGSSTILAGGASGGLALWSAGGGAARTMAGGKSPATGAALNEAGSGAACFQDGAVMAVSGGTGGARLLGRHDGAATGVAVDREGQNILSSSADGSCRLWNAGGGGQGVRLLATSDGWSVVDAAGRFDGSQNSLDGIQWQAPEVTIPIENFSRNYYEPGLLSRSMDSPGSLSGVRPVEQGVHLPPLVEVTLPREGGGSEANVAEVSVTAVEQGKGGVNDVRLFQNGKRVAERGVMAQGQDTEQGARVVTKTYRVALAPGANVMTASALNTESVESSPVGVTITGAAGDAPRFWLLAVGVNTYANSGYNLNYATPDAKAINNFFQAGRGLAFSQGQLRQLNDGQATKAAVLQALRGLRSAPPQDAVILYLAGHGQGSGNSWSFLTHDGAGISAEELKAEVDALSAQRIFLAVDACFAGAALNPLGAVQGLRSLRLLARDMGVHILAATDRDQKAVELSELGHGLFTYTLLRGLQGDAGRGGQVSVLDLMRYVETQAPPLAQRLTGRAQFPTAHSRGVDFALARR